MDAAGARRGPRRLPRGNTQQNQQCHRVLEDGASIKARGESAPSAAPFSSFCVHRASCIPQIIPIPFNSQGSETVDWKKQGEAKCFRGECTMCVRGGLGDGWDYCLAAFEIARAKQLCAGPLNGFIAVPSLHGA